MEKIRNHHIGIDIEKTAQLGKLLNDLLSDYQVFYQNLRGLHWNLKGDTFFELHKKFEEYYNDAIVKIDDIAERILTLAQQPLHTFSDYLATSDVEAVKNVTNGRKGVAIVIDNLSVIIQKERAIMSLAVEADDEGTASLIGDYIAETEKTLWMLNSYLG